MKKRGVFVSGWRWEDGDADGIESGSSQRRVEQRGERRKMQLNILPGMEVGAETSMHASTYL